MKVVFLQSNAVYGACEEYLSLLIRGLGEQGIRSSLICPRAPAMQRLMDEVAGVAEVYPFDPGASGWRTLIELRRQVAATNCDIAHVNDPGILAMAAVRAARVQHRVLTFHTPRQSFHYNTAARLLNRWALRGQWHVIAVSPSNRPPLAERFGFRPDRIHVIPYGLPSERFAGLDDHEGVRREFGVPPGAFLLGAVGRLAPQKNHRLLIEAVSSLPAETRRDLRVVIFGEGDLRSALEDECRRLGLEGEVRLAGHRPDVTRLLAGFDGFALTSDYEGLPFALLEAMALGLPAVATAVDGVADAVADGETGLLIRPGDRDGLGKALEWIVGHRDEARRMGEAARARFLRCYTRDRMVEATRDLYETLVGAQVGREALRAIPLVTAVVTTFNRLEYLKEALASVEAQTYGNIELIVLDDGSTDGTAEFLSSYHPAFPFRFLRFEHQERSFLRNRGVEAARGPYVAFLDDDDVWDSEKVAAQAALLGSSPETGLIYVQTRVIDGSGLLDRGHTRLHRRLYRRQMRGRHSYAELADLCLMFTSAVMVRKDTFLEIGGYDRRWSSNEDLDLYLRMSRATTIRGIPRDLVSYRHHAATLTERLGETKIEVSRAHLEAIRERPELDPDGRVGNALAVSIARHHFYAGDYRAAARAIWALPRRLGSFWLRRENAVMGIRLAWWGAVRGLRGRREQNGPVR